MTGHPVRLIGGAIFIGLLAFVGSAIRANPAPGVPAAQLPPGFTMSVFADNVPVARFLTYSPQGDLYVGQLRGNNGSITILPDRNHDGQADRAVVIATDLFSPNNVTFRPGGFGTVFAAGAYDRVKVYTDTRGDLSFADSAVLIDNLPAESARRHKTKTVAYGPDGLLYVAQGSIADDPATVDPTAGLWRYNPDGSSKQKVAAGLRNTEGYAWDAVGGGLWGADNGSDNLGPNLPHDELNLIVPGGDYGWPNCYDNRVRNPQTSARDCSQTLAPGTLLAAHAGALGIAFYTGSSFPAHYWGGLFVAYHTAQYPDRRAVVFVPFANGQPSGPPEPFVSDASHPWLGLAVNPYDGSLMISDDKESRIYQVRYTGAAPTPVPAAPRPTAMPGKAAPQPASLLPGFARLFGPTGYSLNSAFLQFWFWNGGLARYGYPIGPPLSEPGEDGQTYLVQYTERARLEYHPENRGTQYEVLLGRLAADLTAGRTGEAPFQPATPAPGAHFVTETRHNLSGAIAAYWQTNGGVPVFGYPISEPFMERNPADGKTYQVQYFERNRLEYHPENAGTEYEILLGLLGTQRYTERYGPPVYMPR